MPAYRVKPGYRFGVNNRYGPGDVIELTKQEAAGFSDKLELVESSAGKPKPAKAPAIASKSRKAKVKDG